MDVLSKVPHPIPPDTLDPDSEQGKSVGKRYLVNKLNFINFQDSTILINFKHIKYGTVISLQAKPLPCAGDLLDCVWAENPIPERILQTYALQNLLVADGRKLLLVKPHVKSISQKMLSLELPETCEEVGSRKLRRYPCEGIEVQFIQNSALFRGSLLDFCAVSFRVKVTAVPPQTFQWVNPESPVSIIFSDGLENLYSGECRIIEQTSEQKTRTFVLEPLSHQIRRFAPKEFRTSRLILVPSPNIIFSHPLTRKTVNLKVIDLSGSGFSVEEDEDSSVLLPGLMVPELELSFANSFRVTCKAQVIYRNVPDEADGDRLVKCGLAILDMDARDHVRHLAILQQAKDGKSYVCNEVDLDSLWNFFFETGFIYPGKYAFIEVNKGKLKETYEKLYNQNPHIARHFIYQDKGVILGHMAMVRFYENSWLIHHHAASKTESMKAGLMVLNQISCFVNEIHNFFSAHLNFVLCYFRPENKFPNRIFGGFAKRLNDSAGCSLDTFAYFHFQKPHKDIADLPDPWELTGTRPEDLQELESFYGQESGGLMLHALDLEPDMVDRDQLSQEYQKQNLKRESHLYSLKKDGSLKAVIMVNISDIGLNMSDLTNCTKVIVLDDEDLPRDIFFATLAHISTNYDQNEMPVLLYPVNYAEGQSISYEKLYTMWVLNLQYLDHYFKFCDTIFRRI
jgi:hypothetical protein